MQKTRLAAASLIATSLVAMNAMIAFAEEDAGGQANASSGVNTPDGSTLPKPPVPPKRPMPGTVSMEGKGTTTVKIIRADGLKPTTTPTGNPALRNGQPPLPRGVGSTTMSATEKQLLMLREKELRARLMMHASSTASTTRPIMVPKDKREEWKDDWQKTATTTKEQIKRKVTAEIQGVVNRLMAVVRSLTNISERVDTRADKLAAKGTDVTEAVTANGLAKEALSKAKTDIEGVVTAYRTMASSSNPREAFVTVQNAVNKVKDDLKLAHTYLESAIKALKGAEVGAATTIETNEGESAPVPPSDEE